MKIFHPTGAFSVADDWGLDLTQDYPVKIAALPVLFDQNFEFSYDQTLADLDLSDYDLVILSDIEYRKQIEIQEWIHRTNIKRWVLAIGGQAHGESIDLSTTVYRPWWSYNLMNFNHPRTLLERGRPFFYDALLGARRPHRDFVALASRYHGLESRSIVNYRSVFPGEVIDQHSQSIQEMFDVDLPWPMVSSNLDPDWEVRREITNSVSPFVPWEIWRRTYFSVICETLGAGDSFFMSEKTGKAIFGRRLFVMFGTPGFLRRLRNLGFRTFGDVIDESYDDIEDHIQRWKQAFSQVQYLCQQDLDQILDHVSPVVEHNFLRLHELRDETRLKMKNLVSRSLSDLV